MTKGQEEMIRKYVVTFKNLLAPALKPQVAIRTNIYPYNSGLLLDMQFNLDGDDSTTFHKENNTINEILVEHNIDLPPDVLTATDSHRMCFYGNRILSLKSLAAHLWTPKRANGVVQSIVSAISKAQANVTNNQGS